MDYEAIAAAVISETLRDGRVNEKTLTKSSVPKKRDTRRSHRQHTWRGENAGSNDAVRAIYTDTLSCEFTAAKMPKPTGQRWDGVTVSRYQGAYCR
jgi:hypothetical protein